jgi:hypothetical protein
VVFGWRSETTPFTLSGLCFLPSAKEGKPGVHWSHPVAFPGTASVPEKAQKAQGYQTDIIHSSLSLSACLERHTHPALSFPLQAQNRGTLHP